MSVGRGRTRAAGEQKAQTLNVGALDSLEPHKTRAGRGQEDEVLRVPRREVLRSPSSYLPVQKQKRTTMEGEMGQIERIRRH